ncbi:MAG: outer membrane protein assembly factor BamD, partial [Legionellales bacterium]|nr:outer membrane protein assembly factor BamD [Legionellales bacterium]
MNKLLLIVTFALTLTLTACNSSISVDPLAKYRGFSAKELYYGGEKQLANGNYGTAAQYFEALDANYPFGDYNQRAQLDSIYAYYMNGDSPEAVAAADRYIHLHPQAKDVEYAYYMRGLANFNQYQDFFVRTFRYDLSKRDLSALKQSYADFLSLITLFPNSQYAPNAR